MEPSNNPKSGQGAAAARVLVVSTLYPNAVQTNHGVFVENRLRQTLALGGLEATVLAPVPYFPFTHPKFGRYAEFARIPRRETRHGIEVLHPRYPVIPRFGSLWTPDFMFRSLLRAVRRLEAEGQRFDVIDAHYFYPDGVAAAKLARTLGLPLLITGRGTDLTLIPQEERHRARIKWAADQASGLITVCEDLREHLVRLGAPADRALTLRNGVDLAQFRPQDRAAARAAFGVDGLVLLTVGGLIPRKGHHLAIEALTDIPDATLLIAGSGPMKAELEALVAGRGLKDRVRFLGPVPHARLAEVYSAADVMILASEREGWANVLLESMACGTPVIATDVNGTGEVVRAPEAGRLMRERSAPALVEALSRLRATLPDRAATRAYAEQFDWGPTARANKALLTGAATRGAADAGNAELVQSARRAMAA